MTDTRPDPYDGFEKDVYTVNGLRTVVLTKGDGPPLVFLHGTGTFSGFDAAHVWAESHRVIIPFHPGFGLTDDAPSVTGIADHVAHYEALFDQMNLDRFCLAGFSLGGWIAAEFASRHPGRLSRLVLLAPAGLVSEAAPAPDLFAIEPSDLTGYLAHAPSRILHLFPSKSDPEFDAALGREVGGLAKVLKAHPQGNPDLRRALPQITVPVLLIWGAEDRLRPTAQAHEWIAGLGDAELALVPETGHLVLEETPDSAELVTAFLSRAESGEA